MDEKHFMTADTLFPKTLVRVKRPIVVAPSVTKLPAQAQGAVLVTGSHGGKISAYLASVSGASALIFNDAGGGFEDAGVAGLAWLDTIGMPAAAVSHASARIGDGHDSVERGIISAFNRTAADLKIKQGMRAKECIKRFVRASIAVDGLLEPYGAGRSCISSSAPGIWALDSVAKAIASDAGRILIIGSHGGLHAGEPSSALPVKAALAVFNDAGGGVDNAGFSRLAVLEQQGIAAVAVGHMTARIGDAVSSWDTGIISHVNAIAGRMGAKDGRSLSDWVRQAADYFRM
jgi:hypothetical protein